MLFSPTENAVIHTQNIELGLPVIIHAATLEPDTNVLKSYKKNVVKMGKMTTIWNWNSDIDT